MANSINTGAVSGVIPAATADEIIKDVRNGSVFLRSATPKSVVGGKIKWANLTNGPQAYFVGEGQSGTVSRAVIGATEAEAKKLMVIVPFSAEALEDTSVDLFAEIRPEMVEAIHRKIDQVYLYGNGSVTGVTSVRDAAIAEGNYHIFGGEQDLATDIRRVIEATDPKAARVLLDDALEFDLMDLRDESRRPLLTTLDGGSVQRLYNRSVDYFPGSDVGEYVADLVGDEADETYRVRAVGLADRAIYAGIARDLEYKILDEATLQTDEGDLNLAQQDMLALRITFRVAGAVAAGKRVSVGLETL